MESELLKEPWVFSNSKMSSPKEEDATVLSTWQENFQDLSGWCMDTFQGQCDFHTGESAAFKLSGTKYEGNNVSTAEVGLLKELAEGVTDDEKWSSKMDTDDDARLDHHHHHHHCQETVSDEATLRPTIVGIKVEQSNADCGISDSWSKLPKDAASYAAWSKENGTDASAPFHPGYQIGDLDLDDACSTSFNSAENQRDTWDVLRTVETTGSDTFDLLSYLCDDEVRSTGTTSTAPTVLPRLRPVKLNSTTGVAGENTLKIKSEKKADNPRRRGGGAETRSTSTITSCSSTSTVVVPVRRSERMRTSSMRTYVETSTSTTASTTPERLEPRHGRKRSLESDSSDHMSSVSNYRESREKNNEASRKSRMNKKAKETEMALKAVELERDNRILKMKVEELEKLVTSMRTALLRSALKKEL